MTKFIFSRVAQAVPVIFIVITLTFFMVRAAPGGPFDADRAAPPEVIAALNAKYNLDAPLYEQFFSYLGDMLHGDLGPSFKYPGRSVNEMIAGGFPVTLDPAEYEFCHGTL